LVVATDLKESFLGKTGIDPASLKLLGTTAGKTLEFVKTRHPFMDRPSMVILGEHVTAEAGTGVVHTAPGHGPEDFEIGHKYKLGVLSPVDGKGIFTDEAGKFAGMRFDKANLPIVEYLKELGRLLHHSTYSHSYPHCWRCKKPLIFRATEQWFASVDGCREQALAAIDAVEWIPASGRNRIYAMVQNRTDWCISRQRTWGVPIPVFYCTKCGKHLMTAASIERVAAVFALEGSDSWWQHDAAHFLGANFPCGNCGGTEYTKESDTMDVWFDSGSSHSAVLDTRDELRGSPCEMYLEGSDQHRGWFQSSLLTSVAVHGRAPYKTVLTHGFVVDESGRKMSKSVGNVVDPNDVIKQYGADVLRLWVASVNYTDDIPIGKNMLAQLAEVYKKLRNTIRYLLGNLSDFDPARDRVKLEELGELDCFILHRMNKVIEEVTRDFDRYEFFKYYQVLQTLVGVLVPVTPHLAEDIWQHIPEKIKAAAANQPSVLLTDYPLPNPKYYNEKLESKWSDLINVRNTVNKALEQARAGRDIGSSLEAHVVLSFDDESLRDKISSLGSRLPSFFIASQATVSGGNGSNGAKPLAEVNESGIHVKVLKADGEKCPRCWKYSTKIGSNSAFSDVCDQCADALGVPDAI
jgi:isoleucyl-tRNA synthetase